ncbi:MAG: DUF268 domain-containing protein [Anaerolineae bacterium]
MISKMLERFQRLCKRATTRLQKLFRYMREYHVFRTKAVTNKDEFSWGPVHPCLADYDDASGSASGHYFHQDLLVARRVYARCPERHVDVGSRLDGLVAHIACFRSLEVLDVRSSPFEIPNVLFRCGDITNLSAELVGCADSVSCLHTLEHIGLGRYGDPLCYDGHLLGLHGLHSLLKPEGTLYLSVPIGPLRIEFNAHRVFSVEYMLDHLAPLFSLACFSFVDDQGNLHESIALDDHLVLTNCECYYGCGIFELIKH